MGEYVYRVTRHRVKCSDCQEANVAVFAYKPWGIGFHGNPQNQKFAFETGCLTSQRMADQGKLTGRVVIGSKDGDVEHAQVYLISKEVGYFYDTSLDNDERKLKDANGFAVVAEKVKRVK
jgi:hypothetical protein